MTPQEVLAKLKSAGKGINPCAKITYKYPIKLTSANPGNHNPDECYKLVTDTIAVGVKTNNTSEYKDRVAANNPAKSAPRNFDSPSNPDEWGYFWYLKGNGEPYVRAMFAKGFGNMQTIKYFIDGAEVTLSDLDTMYQNKEILAGYKPRPIGQFDDHCAVSRITDIEIIKDTKAAEKAKADAEWEAQWKADHPNEELNEAMDRMFIYQVSIEKDSVYTTTIREDHELSEDELRDRLIEEINDGLADEKDYDFRDFTIDDVEVDEAEIEDEELESENESLTEGTDILRDEEKRLKKNAKNFYKNAQELNNIADKADELGNAGMSKEAREFADKAIKSAEDSAHEAHANRSLKQAGFDGMVPNKAAKAYKHALKQDNKKEHEKEAKESLNTKNGLDLNESLMKRYGLSDSLDD